VPINQEFDDSHVNPCRSPHSFTPARKSSRGMFALVVSFLVISITGCTFIFTYWKNLSPLVGIIRCLGFVAIMGGVHFVGFRLWQRQNEPNRKDKDANTSTWTREVPGGLFWLVVFVVLFLLLWSLML